MFCLRTAFLNIRRHKQKSILVVLISLIIAFFAFIYVSGIQTNQQQLDALPKSIPVTARIENMDGSKVVGLEISDSLLDNVYNSGYVKDLYYSVQLAANFSDVPNESDKGKEIPVRAVNDINAIPNYKDSNIKLDDSTSIDFLRGKDALCIADDVWLQMKDLSVGDTININLYGLEYDPSSDTFSYMTIGPCSLLIAGSMTSSDSYIICPAGWAREKCEAADVNFYPDSASFTVADPMNLDAFKAAMKKFYLMPVNPQAQAKVYGDALSVEDETFIKTATRLKSNLGVLYSFAAIVFLVIGIIGYAISYLLMQGRRAEVVIMRSLGTSRKECVLIMFYEYAALGLLGSLLGMLFPVIFTGFAVWSFLAFLMFFAGFALGVICAALNISKLTAMSGFVKVEA